MQNSQFCRAWGKRIRERDRGEKEERGLWPLAFVELCGGKEGKRGGGEV